MSALRDISSFQQASPFAATAFNLESPEIEKERNTPLKKRCLQLPVSANQSSGLKKQKVWGSPVRKFTLPGEEETSPVFGN
jgi:hypothetical protein